MNMSALKKKYILFYILAAAFIFSAVAPLAGRTAFGEPAAAADNVAAAPMLYQGASFDYFPSYKDITFDSQFYYILSGDTVYVYNNSGYYAMTEPLDSPLSLVIYDRLLLVVAGDGAGGSCVVFFDTRSIVPGGLIAPAFTYNASEFGGDALTHIVSTPKIEGSSRSSILISSFDGSMYSFAVFIIDDDDNPGDVKLEVSDKDFFITPTAENINIGTQAINSVVYGNYFDLNGIYFSTASGIKHVNSDNKGVVAVPALSSVNSPEISYANKQLLYSEGGILKKFDGTAGVPFFEAGVSVTPSVVACYGDGLLLADNTVRSVSLFSFAGVKVSDVVLSKGSGLGYFDSPSDVYTRNNKLAVADKGNGRVQIFEDGRVVTVSTGLTSPSKLILDSNGGLYVYDSGKVYAFDYIDGLYVPSNGGINSVNLSDFAVGNDGSMYYLNGSEVYIKRKSDTKFTQYNNFIQPKKLAVPVMENALYILSQTSVIKYDGKDTKTYPLPAGANPLDIALDDGGNIYILRDDNMVYKHKINGDALELLAYISSYSSERNMAPGKADCIYISDISDGVTARGDILLTDSAQSVVRKISRDVLDVEYYDEANPAFSAPVDISDTTPLSSGVNIARLTEPAYLYSSPTGTGVIIRMKKDESVVVVAKNISGNDFYSFVAYADNISKKTLYGYVGKNSLGANLTEQSPPYNDGKIYNYSADVFKYPSTNSVKLTRNGAPIELLQGDEFRILSFVPDYVDNCSTAWFKISLNEDGTEIGYISSANAVYKGFLPAIGNPPKTNGSIKSENITGITVYEKNGETYSILKDVIIPNDSRVKIIGTFDPNSEYTRIQCATEYGILDCYVRTHEVHYDGINVLQITAIVMILISVVSVAVALAYYYRKKKSRKQY